MSADIPSESRNRVILAYSFIVDPESTDSGQDRPHLISWSIIASVVAP